MFCNFLLADEINRAPAKVQSALLEVMQERQVTIGARHASGAVAVPRHGDAEPDRVRGHVSAPGGADRPLPAEGAHRVPAARRGAHRRPATARRPPRAEAGALARGSRGAPASRARASTSTRRSSATRSTSRRRRATRPGTACPSSRQYISYGASPRGPISLVQGARALALIRGREYAIVDDLQALAHATPCDTGSSCRTRRSRRR